MSVIQKNKLVEISDAKASGNYGVEKAFAAAGISLTEFQKQIRGKVILPQDQDYHHSRDLFLGGMDRFPAVIVQVANVQDVVHVIALARESGLDLAIRSGGHSEVGHSVCDNGIMLDFSLMKSLEIDATNRTAWVESGVTTGEFTNRAAAYGLATSFGDTGSVGIGGITLGGGVGFLVRKHGLTIDNLLAAQVVTADGQILAVDANHHPDLFWAIRGGGGNFGVVTRFQFRLHDVSSLLGGLLILPASPAVIAGFIEAAQEAPQELSTIANIMPAPPVPFVPAAFHDKLVLLSMILYSGDLNAGQLAVAPFRALAEPIADTLRPITYPEIFMPEEEGNHPLAINHTLFLNRIDQQIADTIVNFLQSSDAPMNIAQLRVLGGAMANVPVDATAFAHRKSRIMISMLTFYENIQKRNERATLLKDFANSIRQEDNGAYINLMGENGQDRMHEAYPPTTWQRLTSIKTRYDPDNLFHLNQNISPIKEN
jgi:hypothetical protein